MASPHCFTGRGRCVVDDRRTVTDWLDSLRYLIVLRLSLTAINSGAAAAPFIFAHPSNIRCGVVDSSYAPGGASE
jgi:hypothetical protein